MAGLEAYHEERIGYVDRQTLDILVRDDRGEIVGGIVGHTSLRCSSSTSCTCLSRSDAAAWEAG